MSRTCRFDLVDHHFLRATDRGGVIDKYVLLGDNVCHTWTEQLEVIMVAMLMLPMDENIETKLVSSLTMHTRQMSIVYRTGIKFNGYIMRTIMYFNLNCLTSRQQNFKELFILAGLVWKMFP